MLYQIAAIIILITFYFFYFQKLISQKKQAIKTNQMGTGNKPKKVLIIERVMSMATVSSFVAGAVCIFFVKDVPMEGMRIAGIIVGVLGVLFFALATIHMKTSWRVGIPEERTTLVTNGIYRWSRNPAFVGFDLLYCSICLMFFHPVLLLISIWAAVMLHLQILQEEKHMHDMCGEEYVNYRQHTLRYFGRL